MSTGPYYSEEFKGQAIQKLLSPGSLGLSETAKKLGLAPSTLFGWKKKYSIGSGMKKTKSISSWPKEKKLDTLLKTATMSEHELGEFLRASGLHSSDLARLKDECLEGLKAPGRPTLDPELVKLRKENDELSKNVKRKDKALAEMSARIILLKKSHEIWGTPEDDE